MVPILLLSSVTLLRPTVSYSHFISIVDVSLAGSTKTHKRDIRPATPAFDAAVNFNSLSQPPRDVLATWL